MTSPQGSSRTAGAVYAILIAALVGVVIAAVLLTVRAKNATVAAPPDFDGEGHGTAIVHVDAGDSLGQVGEKLYELGVVKSTSAFTNAANLNTSLAGIQPGYYQLREEMRGSVAAATLADPQSRVGLLQVSPGARLLDTQVVGGEPVRGIYTLISEASCLRGANDSDPPQCHSPQDIRSAAETADPAALNVPGWAMDKVSTAPDPARRLEGLIAAGNLDFDPTGTPTEILGELIARSSQVYADTGLEQSAQSVGLSPYDLVTAASLIQHEAGSADYGKVARVILNRLNAPMRLQFDSTVNYAQADQEVATTDAAREEQTPWNTYTLDGLPYGPIASPSLDAITAMEKPAEGPWLYFVTVSNDGTTLFTDDYNEHLANQQEAINSGVLQSGR